MSTRSVGVLLCLLTALGGFFIRHDPFVYIPYATIFPALFFAPRAVYRASASVRGRVRESWVPYFERVGLSILALNIPGVLVFHTTLSQFQYDRFLHFSAVVASLFIFVLLLMAGSRVPRSWQEILMKTGPWMLVLLFAWEGFQYLQDQMFSTHTFFDYSQPITRDFWEDIFFGTLGIITGLTYLLLRGRWLFALRKVERYNGG